MRINTLLKKQFLHLILLIISLLFFTGISYGSNLKIKVKADNANVRFKPLLSSSVITTVAIGDILEADKKVGEWYRVILPPNESGFTLSGYLHQSEGEVISEEPEYEEVERETPKKVTILESPKTIVREEEAHRHLKYSESGKIIYTTADLKYDYEIIGVVTHYQEFGGFSLRDPLVGALKKGMEEFEKKVIKMGGDAVVGLRYNFANRTQKDEGRLLIYGTVVKFK